MSFLFITLFVLLITMLQTRRSFRPSIGQKAWGIASPQREIVRFFASLATAIGAFYVHDTHSPPLGLGLMLVAGAIALSWFPGAIRQSRRVNEVPKSLGKARQAVAHERVPDLTFLAVLITPPAGDALPWMNLERNARFFENLPETHVPADGVPALQKFLEAATFDKYWGHPLNQKPDRTSITMSEYDIRTTYDSQFEDIFALACRFVQRPVAQWNNIADAAMAYGTAAALEFADIPIEYLDTLAERREYIRLEW